MVGLPDTRPYTWKDIERAIPAETSRELSPVDVFDLNRIIAPTPDCPWAPALKLEGEGASFYLGGAVRASYRYADSVRAGPEIRYYGNIGPASFFAIHRATYAPRWDTVFDARSWRGDERPVFAEIPDARLDIDIFEWLGIQAGRSQIELGPVPDGGLILSTQPWGIDHAAYSLNWRGVRFTTLYSWLQSDKRMVLHRFEYVARRWKLGVTEVVVSSDSNDILPYIFAPTAFFYFMQWNKGQDENILWGVDATVIFPPFRAYTELLIDDFAYEPETGPHKIGATIGAEWISILKSEVDLRADYTAITKWTYAQRHDNQNYTFRGRILGDDLGPDADRARVWVAWRIIPRLSIELQGFYERHGEGNVWRDFADDGASQADPSSFHPPFPSGVVESHLGAEAEIKLRVIGRSHITLTGRLENVTNVDHVQGSSAVRPRLQADLYWEF